MANSAAIIGAPTVSDVTEDTNSQVLIAAGLISISDANAGQAAFKTTVISSSGNLGALTIAANGAYSYSVADSAVQYLGAGDTKIDTFTVTSVDGTTKKVSFTIHGINDAAVIGTATAHDVTEDATKPFLTTTGSISISDLDQGEASFKTSVISTTGNLGTLTLATNGSYSYSVADSAVQYLGAGDTKVDTFTVTSADGTTKQIAFTIHGVNDAAVIGAPTVHDVTEDASQPALTAIGVISISDADQGQAAFKTTVVAASGDLGSLVIAANGTYTYSVANSAVQYLGAGQTKVDTFTVTSLDGTTKQVSFTIHGVNDAAVIGVPTVHDVTEDATNPILTAIGTISISDADQGQAAFQPALLAGNGNLGILVLAPNGAYVYAVLDGAVQYLGAGDTKVDTFTVTSLDGTTKQVSFTIHGANDAAVIGVPTVSTLTEDVNVTSGNLTASGSISIADADQNQSSFQTAVVAAAGDVGHLVIAANGAYTYTVANAAVQYLGANDTKVDTFTVTSLDGTTKQVSFAIHGANDAAVIGVPTVTDVYKNISATTLTAAGTISISDADQNQASFQTSVVRAPGDLGNLVIAANGSYTYTVAASAVQSLAASAVKVDTFTVTSLDGTTKQISFTIHGSGGVNTPATIGVPSVSSVTENPAMATLTASGSISIADPDAGQAAFQTTVVSASGNLGSLVLAANGNYTYSVADSAVQYLGAGQTKTETFTVTSIDGTTKQVVFTVNGINNAAVIGDPLVHNVTEDVGGATLTASGKLTVSDVDQNQSSFQAATITGVGNLGTLTLAADGTYTYAVDNSKVQYLGATDSKVDTFTVLSADGTAKAISFTIQGANDAAVIGSPAVHAVTENLGVSSAGNLTATGQLTVADADQNQASFQAATITGAGNLGSLTLATDGTYTYSVANAATQYLATGETRTDTFIVHSTDGTPKTITFDVHGVNEAAVIGDPQLHDVTEDATTPTLSVSGQITVGDADHDQSAFVTAVTSAASNLGQLTFSADGHYTYSVGNAAVQSLAAGEVRIETFTVSSVDGTQKPISFTIHGTQDAPFLQANTASGADDAAIPLSISTHLVDDSGTLGPVIITGVPSNYTLNHGTFVLDGEVGGHWEVPSDPATLSTLALVPGADAHVDTLLLHVSVASIESGQQAVAATNLTVNVTAGLGETSNRAVDGYIAGAFVFADANGNGIYDAGEASATTHADGTFALHNPHGTLIMSGGTDISTGLAFAGTLKAPEGSTVVTPLTTLVTSVIASAAAAGTTVTANDAAAQVATAFGIDPTKIDINNFDPVPSAVSGNADATAVLSAGVQVQSTVAQMSAVGATSADVFHAIANTISGTGTVDLTSTATVSAIATSSGVDANAVSAVTAIVQAANTSIQNAPDVTAIAQAGQVAQGAATTQLAATDFSDTTQVQHLQDVYVTDLSTQVTNAVVASPSGPILGTSGNDVLTGTAAIDTIDGLEGNDQISGGDGADLLFGGVGNDRIAGNAGNDRIDGGAGFDRALYTDATGGVTINMAAGTASGAGVDSDSLVNVEGIVGSAFADAYNATGFTGNSGVAGTPIGYNEFEGGGGNDTVTGTVNAQGASLTRVSYASATAGVTVDIATGIADGNASVGHDTFMGGIQSVFGSAYADTLLGSNNGFGTVEVFAGFAGNDVIDGRGGFDRADYNQDPTTTSGITVHLAAGTVTGDASVGTDTLVSVEAVRGTAFADTYDATGFSGTSVNAGSFGTFNEFTGGGGNDTIIGNGNTRISFNNATAGVTVDLQTGTTPGTGTATGDASVGTDTFSGVNAVQGSMFNDTIYGSNNTAATETFTGNGGDDYIDGRGGFDIASYNNIYLSTGGVTVNMAAGIVTGDSSIGTDTLKSIEGIQGTVNHDVYDATGYGFAGALNVGNNGQFNQFEGLGGNDTITGNGNTRVIYANATAAVTVDLSLGTAHGTAAGDVAAIGTDTFTSGVNSVTGSAFNDTLIGDGNANTFNGGGGNDTINGNGAGDIAIYSGTRSQYNFTTTAGVTTITDSVAGRDGTDTLTNVEVLQFSNVNVLINSGTAASPVDLSDYRLFFGGTANSLSSLSTSTNNDYVKINQQLSGHTIDLGAGTDDTVILGITGGYNLNLANVEHLIGTSGDDFVGLLSNVNGLTIDMGGGNDTVNLVNGINSVSVANTESLNGSDFTGTASNDTLTLLNNVSGLSVNLAQGNNTLNLAADTNSFTSIFNVQHINGTTGDDTLTISTGFFENGNNPIVDLGAGNNTLNLGLGGLNFTALNIQHLNGNSLDNFITLNNNVSGMSVDLGAGSNDTLNLANGSNTIGVTNVESVGGSDFAGAASNDTLTLSNNVSGLTVNLGQGLNTLNLAAGTNQIDNLYNVDTVNGSATDDTLTVSNGLFTPNNDLVINMGGGNDTVNLGTQYATLGLVSVEFLNGNSQDNNINLTSNATGLSVDLGVGNDTLGLANGVNSISAFNIENITGSDFGNPSDDTLSLLNDVSGVTVNLGDGNNILNLAAGSNSFVNLWGISLVNGSSSNDTLTLQGNAANTIDLSDGTDTLILGNGLNNVTVRNIENVVGGSNNDSINIADLTATVTVTGGLGADFVSLGGSHDNIRFTSVADSAAGGGADTVANFDVANDAFVLDHVAGLASAVHFVSNAVFDGTPAVHQSEARLVGNLVQIDVDGDGQIGAGDMEIYINGLNGNLTDANFVSIGIDHAPTDILLSANTVAENSANGVVVGALSALDPDAGDSATFSLTNNAGGLFAITNGNLVVNGPLDFETGSSQLVSVRVTDSGGLTYDKNFTIGVINVNEAPTNIDLAGTIVPENSGNGAVVGFLTSSDPDAGDSATYSLVDSAGGLFALNGSTLVVNGPLDYETAASKQVTVRVTDSGGLTYDKNFTIGVTNVNEAPTGISLSGNTVAENSANGTAVGFLTSSDPDAADTATYSLTSSAGGKFALTGNILVVNGPLDYETATSQQVTVRVTDSGGLTYDKIFAIGITDVNEAPTAVVLSNTVTSTPENGGDGKVADIAITDDATGSNVLSLTGADASAFSIVTGANGKELHFNGGANFEAKTGYDVTVLVNDTTASNHVVPDAFQAFHLAITNVNEVATNILLSNSTVGQSTANGTVIGALSAVDPDASDTATFSIVNDASGQFAVSGNNLVVAGSLTAGAQQVIVRDTDAGGLTFDKVLTINVSSGATVVGNAGNNTLVGTAGDDLIQGLGGNDRLQGLGGDDTLDGGAAFDRAIYTDATGGITASLAAGTASGPGVGNDTLISIEGLVGSAFADNLSAAGFTGDTGIAGTNIGFNEIEGGGGDDTITSALNSQGALLTRISYVNASSGVVVNLTAHTATGGDGNDTLVGSGFAGIVGSAFADTLIGSNNAAGTVEVFDGRAGNDTLNGGAGFDRADYAQDPLAVGGITVNLAAGTVIGDAATVGTDTLISIESVRGSNAADTFNAGGFTGTSTNAGSNGTFNEFNGMGGNDTINGNGNTRVTYINATGGVTVDLQTGVTPGTGTADGDASTGHDTFNGVNAIQASMFDDTLYGSNSTASTETFYGGAGNDYIDGRGGFDLATYNNIYFSTGAVTVNMGAGTATGDASVGSDTLRSIEAVQGTNFNDTFDASTFGTAGALNIGNNGTFNQFEGIGGNDSITGNGNTRVIYSNATAGVTINMQAGTAIGDASVGTDTFTGVNSATGSAFADTYNATSFVDTGAFTSGTFNLFEGLAGNDDITGNGNTRVAYSQATAGVTVNLATGVVSGAAGADIIHGGVNSVQGSNFNDTLTGGSGNETFFGGGGADTISAGGGNDQITGQGGNDSIDGGVGTDVVIFTGTQSQYTINLNTPGAGQIQVVDSQGAARDGTDTLTNVEVLQFTDATVLLSSGTSGSPIDISSIGFSNNTASLNGTAGDDYVMVGGVISGHPINLGAGNDTLLLAGGYTLNILNVENLIGSSGDDFVALTNTVTGLFIDLGAGTNDQLNLANGSNSLSVNNVEYLNSSDFGVASNDTLTLLNDVSGLSVNLQQGDNTLNLAAGTNSFTNIFSTQHINGTAFDDTLTVTNGIYEAGNNPIVDLGAGDNTLNIGGGGSSLTLLNIQHLNGSSIDNFITLNNDVSGLAVDLGAGSNDSLNLAIGTNSLSVINVESLSSSDFIGVASDDTLTLLGNVNGGLTVNLQQGSNTLNLASGSNTFDNLWNIDHVNGTSSNDTLTFQGGNPGTIDLGAGSDTLNINGGSFGLTVVNVENIIGSANYDNFTISNASTGSTTVTAGVGADAIVASAGLDNFHFTSVADSTINGQSDSITNFDASHDTFTFSGMGITSLQFVGNGGAFIGAGQTSAHLVNNGPGNDTLEVDINGDGAIDGADMVVNLTNLTGTLHNGNFILT